MCFGSVGPGITSSGKQNSDFPTYRPGRSLHLQHAINDQQIHHRYLLLGTSPLPTKPYHVLTNQL